METDAAYKVAWQTHAENMPGCIRTAPRISAKAGVLTYIRLSDTLLLAAMPQHFMRALLMPSRMCWQFFDHVDFQTSVTAALGSACVQGRRNLGLRTLVLKTGKEMR